MSLEPINGHFFLLPDPDSFDVIFSSLGVATDVEVKDVDIVKVGIADMNLIKYPSLIRTSGFRFMCRRCHL